MKLHGYILIGEINDETQIAKFAEMLQPSFQRQGWKWVSREMKLRIPSADDVRARIEDLKQHAADRNVLERWASSGGMQVVIEDGRAVLYVEESLAPEGSSVPESDPGSEDRPPTGVLHSP